MCRRKMYSSNTAFPRPFSFRRMVRLPHRKAIPKTAKNPKKAMRRKPLLKWRVPMSYQSGEPQAKKCHPVEDELLQQSLFLKTKTRQGVNLKITSVPLPDLKLLLLGLVSRGFPCSHLMIKDQSQRTNRALTRGRTPKELSHASLIRRLTRFGNHVPRLNIILNTKTWADKWFSLFREGLY